MPWGLIISLGYLALDYAWNHWINPSPGPKPSNEFQLPTTQAGAPYPLIYGRGRVNQAVLAWCDTPVVEPGLEDADGNAIYFQYGLSMHLVLGLPFLDGEQHVLSAWAGEAKFDQTNDVSHANGSYGATTIFGLKDLVGDGNVEDAVPSGRGESIRVQQNPTDTTSLVLVGGAVEFLNGNTSQLLVGDTFPYNPLTRLTEHMTETITVGRQPFNSLYGTTDPQRIGSCRGALSVFLFGHVGGLHWLVGQQPKVDSYSFEVSSYPSATDTSYPSQGTYRKIGNYANPADVIYDLLTGKFGKLGLDPSLIDMVSFKAAAYTLWSEGHGYSRIIQENRSGTDIISEVLAQIAGSLYEDPTTGLMVLKLIRNDFDPKTVRVIDASNCKELTNLQLSGWYGLATKIRVVYSDENDNYRDNSVTAQNMANAVGQDGLVSEQVLQMPGITTAQLALAVAQRELSARSRPSIACTAIMDRSFATARPGDVYKLNWTAPGISGQMFRVATVDLGTLEDGAIKLGLVQDPFFVWNDRPPVLTGLGGHGDVTLLEGF